MSFKTISGFLGTVSAFFSDSSTTAESAVVASDKVSNLGVETLMQGPLGFFENVPHDAALHVFEFLDGDETKKFLATNTTFRTNGLTEASLEQQLIGLYNDLQTRSYLPEYANRAIAMRAEGVVPSLKDCRERIEKLKKAILSLNEVLVVWSQISLHPFNTKLTKIDRSLLEEMISQNLIKNISIYGFNNYIDTPEQRANSVALAMLKENRLPQVVELWLEDYSEPCLKKNQFFQIIRANQTLTKVSILCKNWSGKNFQKLAEAIKANKNLREVMIVDLSKNPLSDRMFEHLIGEPIFIQRKSLYEHSALKMTISRTISQDKG